MSAACRIRHVPGSDSQRKCPDHGTLGVIIVKPSAPAPSLGAPVLPRPRPVTSTVAIEDVEVGDRFADGEIYRVETVREIKVVGDVFHVVTNASEREFFPPYKIPRGTPMWVTKSPKLQEQPADETS